MWRWWSLRVTRITGRYVDAVPVVPACCNACRACTTTNVLTLVSTAGMGVVALIVRFAKR